MFEFLKSVFESSKERFKNPLLGTFVISWLVVNWEPLSVFLLSTKTIETRITYIKLTYSNLIILPIVIALSYYLVLPYVMGALEYLIKKAYKIRKSNQTGQKLFDIQEQQRIAEEEAILENIKANNRDQVDQNRQIKRLKKQLDERDKEIQSLAFELTNLKDDNVIPYDKKSPEMSTVLFEKLKKKDLINSFNNVCVLILKGSSVADNTPNLEEFISLGLIKFLKNTMIAEKKNYEITDVGESVLNKIRLDI